jgi:hypothetical protein
MTAPASFCTPPPDQPSPNGRTHPMMPSTSSSHQLAAHRTRSEIEVASVQSYGFVHVLPLPSPLPLLPFPFPLKEVSLQAVGVVGG